MALSKKDKNRITDKPRTVFVDAISSKKGKGVLPFVMQLLLLYICLVGFLYCVTTSLQSEIPLVVVALIAFPCILIAGLLSINTKVHIIFLSAFTVGVAAVLILARDLTNTIISSFEFCYNRTIQIVVDEGYDNYSSLMTEDITEKLTDGSLMNQHFYCVLIILAILFSVVFTASMMKRSMVWLCTLPCFAVLTPSLYFGAVPSGPAFAIFISGIIGCYIESLSYTSLKKLGLKKFKKDKKNKKQKKTNIFLKSSAVSGLSNTALVLIVSLTVSMFVYSSDLLRLDELRKIIDDVAMRIMNVLFYEHYETAEGAIGGLIENDTLDLKVPEFRELPVMDVTTRTNTAVYLRGWIGKNLDKDGWKVLSDEDTENYKAKVPESFDPYTQFYNFMTLMSTNELSNAESEEDTKNLGFIYDTVNVKSHFTKSKMAFIPIAGITGEIKGEYKGIEKRGDTINFFEDKRPKNNYYTVDSALQSFTSSNFYVAIKQKQKSYLNYASAIPLDKQNPNKAEEFIIAERKYTQYVKSNYLDIPQSSPFLKSLARSVSQNYTHDFDKALSIERYLKTECQYSLTAQTKGSTALEKIEYVVIDGKVGYCTYYASAMTLMLRELNIPARYVVGYHSKTQEDNGTQKYTRNLVDKNYHAWVEAYFEGIGWLTFDPTPGYGNNASIRDYDYLDKETPPEPDESIPQEPQQQQQAQEVPPKVHEVIENVPEAAAKDFTKIIITICIILGVILLIFIIVIVIVSIIKGINNKYQKMFTQLQQMNKTLMVRAIYPKLLKILSGFKLEIKPGELVYDFAKRVDEKLKFETKFISVVNQLEMSQFSKNEISYENAKKVYLYFITLSNESNSKFNIFKRFYYKIILPKK